MVEGSPVSISSVLASGMPLRPHEAVAVVVALCRHLSNCREAAGVTAAISSATVTIDARGQVGVTGGVACEDEQTVSLAGRLLLDMLDHSRASVEAAVPPRLRSAAVRAAVGGREAFPSLAQFVSALRRHGPEYGEARAIQGVFERWAAGAGPGERLGPDRRRTAPPPDVMRRFLRESEQEAYRARVAAEASLPSVAAGPAASTRRWPRIGWSRMRRPLLVAAMLMVLAGAWLILQARGSGDELPLVAPVAKPTPVMPRREPGWELLGKPERTSNPPQRTPQTRRARAGDAPVLTTPAQGEWAVPGR